MEHFQSERVLGASTKSAVAIREDRLQNGLGLRQEAPTEAPGWEEHALCCLLVPSTGRGLKGQQERGLPTSTAPLKNLYPNMGG